MPIYEYECKRCCHHFEVLQKMSEKKLQDCPVCHEASLERLVSATGFQLKGSGWYVTDFKDKPTTQKEDKKESTVSTADVKEKT